MEDTVAADRANDKPVHYGSTLLQICSPLISEGPEVHVYNDITTHTVLTA